MVAHEMQIQRPRSHLIKSLPSFWPGSALLVTDPRTPKGGFAVEFENALAVSVIIVPMFETGSRLSILLYMSSVTSNPVEATCGGLW